MKNKKQNIHEDIDKLIVDFLANEISSEDKEALHLWLQSSSENQDYFLKLREVWFSVNTANPNLKFDKAKAYQTFIKRKETYQLQNAKPKKQVHIYLRRVAVAAVVASCFGIIGYYLGFTTYQDIDRPLVEVEAPLGSRSKIHLPDGSLVWLNAGSYISYNQNFGVKDRSITLKGEGYFEVVNKDNKPFYVNGQNVHIQVLGTKFNVRNHLDEKEIRVTLVDGRVAVNSDSPNAQRYNLMPNQQFIFDREQGTAKIVAVTASNSCEWTNGYLFFDEERLTDIARELERSYNVKIIIADESLMSYRFYGNFTRLEQTIQEVLEVLASTDKLRYEIDGKTITLKQKLKP